MAEDISLTSNRSGNIMNTDWAIIPIGRSEEKSSVKSLLIVLVAFIMVTGIKLPDTHAGNGAAEIESLLSIIGTCGCEFYRNGIWYPGTEAQAHLTKKYNYLHEKGLAETAEEFITNVAAKSDVSGEQYQIRCGSQTPVPSTQWLMVELQRLRAQPGIRSKN